VLEWMEKGVLEWTDAVLPGGIAVIEPFGVQLLNNDPNAGMMLLFNSDDCL